MQALTYHGPKRLSWDDAPDVELADPRAAIVRPLAVALCDLDWVIVRGIAPFTPPFVLGHEGVARVVAVGADVGSVVVGDLVVVSFQISCGVCAMCERGLTGNCANVRQRGAMYGIGAAGGNYGGFLADAVLVPFADTMLTRVPAGLDPVAIASVSDNVVDGYRTVAPFLERYPGSEVLVCGGLGASVALFAVANALALGASRVDYVDADADRRAIAAGLGANVLESFPDKILPAYPLVVDVSGDIRRLQQAIAATAAAGTCVVAAMYFGETTPLPLYRMFFKGMQLETGRANAVPAIPKVLALIEAGKLRPQAVTTRVVSWDAALDTLLGAPQTKLIVTRQE